MKKIITNIALASIALSSQAQENQTDTTQHKLHTNLVWYVDFATQKQTNNIKKYQYELNGLNHWIVWFQWNFWKQQNWNFSLLWQTWWYVHSNYTNKDSVFVKYIHDANISRQFNQKDSNFIKVEGWIFWSSPIWQSSIIPISLPDSISWQKPPRSIINNIIQQSRTQLSENTPYYITWLFITRHHNKWDIKLGITTGAQHIVDNNTTPWLFWATQYTTKNNNQFYICYHISDEWLVSKNMQHIWEGHAIVHIGDIDLIPSAYINQSNNTTIYGINIWASFPINKTTKLWTITEYNKNPQQDVFPNEYYRKTIFELQKVLTYSLNNNTIISWYIGLDNTWKTINTCAGLSVKMTFKQKIK